MIDQNGMSQGAREAVQAVRAGMDVQVEPQNSRLEIVSFEYPESG
jgi:hypothetical protein